MLTTCARDYVTWANEIASGAETVHGVMVRRFPVVARTRSDRVRAPVGARVRRGALARRRARVARQRGSGEPGARRLHRAAPRRVRLFPVLQLSLLPRLSRRGAADGRGDPRAHRGAGRGDRARPLPAALPRRVRADVQLARGTGDDRARGAAGSCRAWWSASARTCPRIRSRSASGRSSGSRPRLRSTSAASTPTRDASSCSTTSSATCGRCRGPAPRAHRQVDPADSRASAHPPPRLPDRRAEVRRDGRRRGPADAVLLREPVDGDARGVGARQAGADQRAAATCSRASRSAATPASTTTATREFAEALHAIVSSSSLRHALGANGRAYFEAHYAWPVIERKYLEVLDRLTREDAAAPHRVEPLPGWFARRTRDAAAGGRSARQACRPGRCSHEPAGRAPGARDARLRRRHRPRGARHPARAARRGLRVRHLRRDRRSAPRDR